MSLHGCMQWRAVVWGRGGMSNLLATVVASIALCRRCTVRVSEDVGKIVKRSTYWSGCCHYSSYDSIRVHSTTV